MCETTIASDHLFPRTKPARGKKSPPFTLAVFASRPGAGASRLARSLCRAIGASGWHVVLVDGNPDRRLADALSRGRGARLLARGLALVLLARLASGGACWDTVVVLALSLALCLAPPRGRTSPLRGLRADGAVTCLPGACHPPGLGERAASRRWCLEPGEVAVLDPGCSDWACEFALRVSDVCIVVHDPHRRAQVPRSVRLRARRHAEAPPRPALATELADLRWAEATLGTLGPLGLR